MRDIIQALRMTGARFASPVRSLLDVDFYKATMGQLIFNNYRDVEVTFKLIVRDGTLPVADIVNETELRKYLDEARTLHFSRTDMYYLRGMDVYGRNMFSEPYLEYLRDLRLPPYKLQRSGGEFHLTFCGLWPAVTWWETIALAIISELYYRALMDNIPDYELEIVYARAEDKIYTKLERLRRHPEIRFADFGQRRRHSFLWQEWVIGICRKMMGDQFVGTSNTWMAFHHDLVPIGTNAHELPMVLTALANSDDEMRMAQYKVLELWEQLYGQGLRIFLPDTYGTEQFLRNAPEPLTTWRGMRQDSGDPVSRGHAYVNWLESRGKDPRQKLVIFSDGLDVDTMVDLYEHFRGIVNVSFGWGTLLTNDFEGCHSGDARFRPFSMVCKVAEANGRPVVKLSDNPNKATGPREEVERYMRVFGTAGRTEQLVRV